MKKGGKIALGIVLGLVLVLGIFVAANWQDIYDFVPVAAGAYAKFMCSSIFVEGKTEAEAVIWSKLPLAVSSYSIDYEAKTVTVWALLTKRTARYLGGRDGTVLD